MLWKTTDALLDMRLGREAVSGAAVVTTVCVFEWVWAWKCSQMP